MMHAETAPMGAQDVLKSPTIRKAVLAGVFGTMMEWYDLVTYGFLAAIIGRSFFPTGNETASLLAAFASFGVGFLARPLGGLIFGAYADKHGRKAAMMLSMVLMAVSTVIIGLTPTYATIGVVAPVILVVARILQGISAGGEGPTALSFVVEWAPKGKRGLIGSFQSVASGCGLLLGSATLTVLTSVLSTADMESWGWRVPFIIGFLVGPFGMWIRRSVGETPAFRRAHSANAKTQTGAPLKAASKAFMFLIFWSIGYYVFLTYMPTFSTHNLHIDAKDAIRSNTIALLVYVCVIPFFGWLSDRIGRRPLLTLSCVLFVILPYPMFSMLLKGASVQTFMLVEILFVIVLAMYSGPSSATLAEMFPTRSRSKWLAIGYGISVAIFGGFTPFAVTWLIKNMNTPLAVAYYVSIFALIGGIFVFNIKETAHGDLE